MNEGDIVYRDATVNALEALANHLPEDKYVTSLLIGVGGEPCLSVGRRNLVATWVRVIVSRSEKRGFGYVLTNGPVWLAPLDSPGVAASRVDIALPVD